MALVLKIVGANGVERTVQAKPGDRIDVRRGDTVTVVEGAGVRVERIGNDLVIIYDEGRIVLGGFYPDDPGSAPGLIPAPLADGGPVTGGVPTLIFESPEGLNV